MTERVLAVVDAVSAGVLALLAVIGIADVLARYLLGFTLPGAYELTQQLQAIGVLWALATVTRSRTHICVDLLWERGTPRWKTVIDQIAGLATAIALGILAWACIAQIPQLARSSEVIPRLGIPTWWLTAVAVATLPLAAFSALLAPSDQANAEPSEGINP